MMEAREIRIPLMSVLIVEDNPERIKKFRRGLIGASVTNLTTARAAIRWLEDHASRLIFLDYDLDDHGTPIKESGTGGEVAMWMSKHPRKFSHSLVVIHSLNDHGAQKMFDVLHKEGIATSLMPSAWEKPLDLERLVRGL
jgi:CheY-like chemotaxis protein